MGFIKNIAREILWDEIKGLDMFKEKAQSFEKRTYELRNEIAEKERAFKEQLSKAEKDSFDKDIENQTLKRQIEEFQKENEFLKQYYNLDKEPSDEIKMKIHIDLEINRLKEENLKLIVKGNQPQYLPIMYPYYGFGRGFI